MDYTAGFVIGNGTSRLDFELPRLRACGCTYGCNALYRDFHPDVLITLDEAISTEILSKPYITSEIIYRDRDYSKLRVKSTGKFLPDPGWSAGPIATHLLLSQYPTVTTIYWLGIDLYGNGGRINNVYAGTNGYRPTTSKPPVSTNWIAQFKQVFDAYPFKQIYRVGRESDPFPKEWEPYKDRVAFISYAIFEEHLSDLKATK